MGRLVGKLAGDGGHEVALTLDLEDAAQTVDDLVSRLHSCDVAIDFSIADAVPKNAEACARARVPLVVGTTGWQSRVDEVRNIVTEHDGALIYGANFSVGVQLFYRIASKMAGLFRALDSYDGFIEETHGSFDLFIVYLDHQTAEQLVELILDAVFFFFSDFDCELHEV